MPTQNLYFDSISWCDAVAVFSDPELTIYFDPGVPAGTAIEIIFNNYKREWTYSTKTLSVCVGC